MIWEIMTLLKEDTFLESDVESDLPAYSQTVVLHPKLYPILKSLFHVQGRN